MTLLQLLYKYVSPARYGAVLAVKDKDATYGLMLLQMAGKDTAVAVKKKPLLLPMMADNGPNVPAETSVATA